MAVVAGLVLRSYTLNVVRRGQFPGGKRVEIGQAVLQIRCKEVRICRGMSQYHILERSVSCPVGVEANLEEHFRFLTLVVGKPLIVGSNVASEAVPVWQPVAHLAGNLIIVNGV